MRTERRPNTALPPRLGRHTACTNNPAAPPSPPKVIFLPLLLHLSRVSLSPNHRKRFDCAADGGGGQGRPIRLELNSNKKPSQDRYFSEDVPRMFFNFS